MRSHNYAYSAAFEFFHRKGVNNPLAATKLAMRFYDSGESLISAMEKALTGQSC